jgi:hypothetical protein
MEMIVKEIIDPTKKPHREYLIFKVDFEKVYDNSISWGFLYVEEV